MKLDLRSPKPWKISQDCCEIFYMEEIQNVLKVVNRAGQRSYVIVDYFKQRLIVGPSSNSMITGYSKDTIKKEGFGFYDRILSKQELNWFIKMHEAMFKIFYDYPIEKRYDLEFFYDLLVQTSSGTELILQHKLVPLRLDQNGNMWLCLGLVTPSTSLYNPIKARIIDVQAGDKYNFMGDRFELTTTKVLNQEDTLILKWMSRDVTAEVMCSELGISESSLNRKKKKIYELLGAQGATGAIHKAHLMGVI